MSNREDEENASGRFTALAREITVAAREQGGDPDENYRLRFAMKRARDANMPADAVERARRRGIGELEGPVLVEKIIEGYGIGGTAVLVETITSDAARTVAELENIFETHGGNIGQQGCVAWQFERRGIVEVDSDHVDDQDAFMLEVIEMGGEEIAESIVDRGDVEGRVSTHRVYCDPEDVGDVARGLADAGYPVRTAATIYEATQNVPLEPSAARSFVGFMETLLGHRDVQNAYANWQMA